jgi:segregation and condensation protein B
VTAAVEALTERRKGTGVEVAALSSGWHLRTNPENADWVSKLLVGRPVRLSRAMLETLAIVAYRQPVTRPEIDDIRGVDCGPVLKTLLDRGLVRIIGKKEEVGRPMLYGTTPEFLRIFNLRDLSELPTLREFYDLSAEDQSRVEAEHGAPSPDAQRHHAQAGRGLEFGHARRARPSRKTPTRCSTSSTRHRKLAKQALGELEPEAAEEAGAASRGRKFQSPSRRRTAGIPPPAGE